MNRLKKVLVALVLFAAGIGYAAELMLTGAVVSDNQKIITSRYMGFVKTVAVSEGDRVKKGQLLYEIDSKEIDSKKEQASSALQMYRDQYANVLLNLERYKRLYAKDMVAKYELENLELAEKNLKSMVSIAEAQLAEVMNQYQYLKIKAPNNGVVVAKNIKVGEMAIPGMPAIVLSDLSDLKIMTEVAETDLKDVTIGKKVELFIPSINLKGEGKVSAIIPSSNPMTHKFALKVSFDFGVDRVYPGMYAEIIVK